MKNMIEVRLGASNLSLAAIMAKWNGEIKITRAEEIPNQIGCDAMAVYDFGPLPQPERQYWYKIFGTFTESDLEKIEANHYIR